MFTPFSHLRSVVLLICGAVAVLLAYVLWTSLRIPLHDRSIALFIPSDSPGDLAEDIPENVARFRHISINEEVIENMISTAVDIKQDETAVETLLLNLFDDTILPLQIIDIEQPANPTGMYLINGAVEGVEFSIATITVKGGAMFAIIDLPDADFRIVPIDPPLHRIDQLSTSADTFILD